MAAEPEKAQPRAGRYALAQDGKDHRRYAIDLSALGLDTIERPTPRSSSARCFNAARSGNERRPECLHPRGLCGGCAPHCRRTVPQLRHGGGSIYGRFSFRCA